MEVYTIGKIMSFDHLKYPAFTPMLFRHIMSVF